MSKNIVDALLTKTIALPETNETVVSESIEIKSDERYDYLAESEISIDLPALTVAQLSDGAKMTSIVEHSDDNSSFETLAQVAVQTGAGGVGADAIEDFRVGIPSTAKNYIRLAITADTDLDAKSENAVIAVVV